MRRFQDCFFRILTGMLEVWGQTSHYYLRCIIEKISSIHMGPAASQMERRDIATEKGNINRQIADDNRLLKEIKARITSMQELYEKFSSMNIDYYDLRGKIIQAERRITILDERLKMCAQYDKYKPIRQQLDKVKPDKREQYQQEHKADFEMAEYF